MKKKIVASVNTAFLIILFSGLSSAYAENMSVEEAGLKAAEIHRVANSDVIYVQEETKALYYQNLQIIGLLGEIRDLMEKSIEQKKEVSESQVTEGEVI